MPRIRSLDPALSPLHFYGAELRRAREAAGMTLAEFGALVPCDKSTASRVESGFTVPDDAYVLAADRAFPEAGGWFGRFFEAHFGWGVAYPPEFRSFVPDEARACALYVFEHSLLPGLLSTEAYAREVLTRTLNVSEELINERVAARLARQAVLDRADPPLLYWAVLDDAVLSRCVGSAEIMRDALLHLAEMSRRPNVTVQVLAEPGGHMGLQGAFNIAEIPGSSGTVFLEDGLDGRCADDLPAIAEMSVRFRWLQSEALPATASRALIERMADTWNSRIPAGGSLLSAAQPALPASR